MFCCRAGRPWHPDARTDPPGPARTPSPAVRDAAQAARCGQQRSGVPAEAGERVQGLVERVDRDHLEVVADRLPHLLELVGGHEEHLVAGVAHRDRLLGAAAHRPDACRRATWCR